jgi:hypothetical protein
MLMVRSAYHANIKRNKKYSSRIGNSYVIKKEIRQEILVGYKSLNYNTAIKVLYNQIKL